MDVASHRQRTRQSSPFRASSLQSSSLTARNTIADENPNISVKSGHLSVDRVTYPGEIAPNGTVTVEVTVANGAYYISPLDPDFCLGLSNGYEFDVEVDPTWTTAQTDTDCIKTAVSGVNRKTYTFQFAAPTIEGAHEMQVSLGVTNEAATGQYIVQVSRGEEDTTTGCSSDDDCGAGYACVNGVCLEQDNDSNNGDSNGGRSGPILPCFLDPNRKCAGPEATAWIVLVTVVLAAVVLS